MGNGYRLAIGEELFLQARTIHHLTAQERRRKVLFTVLAILAKLVLLVGAYYVAPFDRDSRDDIIVRVLLAVAIIAVAVYLSAKSVLNSEFPVIRATDGIATLLILTVVVFASTYVLISASNADAFSEPLDHTAGLYFTMTTTTTIGYGDISPKTDPARIVVMVHMVVNVLLVGIAARLLFQTAKRRIEAS